MKNYLKLSKNRALLAMLMVFFVSTTTAAVTLPKNLTIKRRKYF